MKKVDRLRDVSGIRGVCDGDRCGSGGSCRLAEGGKAGLVKKRLVSEGESLVDHVNECVRLRYETGHHGMRPEQYVTSRGAESHVSDPLLVDGFVSFNVSPLTSHIIQRRQAED